MKARKYLLVTFLLLAGVALATPGRAATLLSNMAATTDQDFGGLPDVADHFSTGSIPMTVTGIDLVWTNLGPVPATNRVGLHADNAGLPGAALVGSYFTNPNATALGAMSYSGNVTLASNTTYWVVVNVTDGSLLASTNSTSFVADPGAGGAVILPGSTYGNDATGTWQFPLILPKLKFAINGQVTVPTLDVDTSVSASKYDALTDGLLIARYLSGRTGGSLTVGALGGTATRTDPTEIQTYLDSIRPSLDIDGNGTSGASTDGVLILRYMLGLRGSSLVAGVVDPLGTRTTATDIETYIQSLMP